MKDMIKTLLKNQINRIVELGDKELLSPEYLTMLFDNFDFISFLFTEDKNKTDTKFLESLSVLVSKIK